MRPWAVVTSVVLGSVLLSLIGPVLGEVVATLPPLFSSPGANPYTLLGLPFQNVAFHTGDGLTLRGWFIPTDVANAPAIIYAPGTAQDQASGLQLVKPLVKAGYNVLLFSYRGSGKSDGDRTGFTYGHLESIDLDSAVQFLMDTKGIRSIGVVGFSAGAAAAILSAARNPGIEVVVAASSYNSLQEVWQSNSPRFVPDIVLDFWLRLVEWRKGFRRDAVEPLGQIARISPRPVLLIQGDVDSRVTVAQVQRLFSAAGSPVELWIVKGATHRLIHDKALVALAPEITTFLDNALRPQAVWERAQAG